MNESINQLIKQVHLLLHQSILKRVKYYWLAITLGKGRLLNNKIGWLID